MLEVARNVDDCVLHNPSLWLDNDAIGPRLWPYVSRKRKLANRAEVGQHAEAARSPTRTESRMAVARLDVAEHRDIDP